MPESLLGGTKNNSLMLRCMLHLCALSACLLFAWAARAVCVALCALCGVWSLCWVLVPGALSGSSWLWCSWLLASAGNYSPSHAYAYACAWHLAGCASGTLVVGPRLLCVLVAVFFCVVVACCTEASPKPSLGWVSCLCGTRVVLAYVRGCLHVDSGSNLNYSVLMVVVLHWHSLRSAGHWWSHPTLLPTLVPFLYSSPRHAMPRTVTWPVCTQFGLG